MTEIIINNIENINDLALFADSFKRGIFKLNVSKPARELNKDRKTIRNYLNGKTPSTTRKRIKYLDDYSELILKLLTDKYRTFDYIDHLHNYLDRILHYSYLFNITGPSYRIKDKLRVHESEES